MFATEDVTAPVQKAVTGIAAAAGSGLAAVATAAESFWPTTAVGWLALCSAAVATGYTVTLWAEWWWKKVWRPLIRRYKQKDGGPVPPFLESEPLRDI